MCVYGATSLNFWFGIELCLINSIDTDIDIVSMFILQFLWILCLFVAKRTNIELCYYSDEFDWSKRVFHISYQLKI